MKMSPEELLSKARDLAYLSTCERRQIAALTVLRYRSRQPEIIVGVNRPYKGSKCVPCTRDIDCPAMHAEIQCINNANPNSMFIKELYVFAEVPCCNCLTYIKANSNITHIYCLSQDLYSRFYPRVLEYDEKIKLRKSYAERLKLNIIEITDLV